MSTSVVQPSIDSQDIFLSTRTDLRCRSLSTNTYADLVDVINNAVPRVVFLHQSLDCKYTLDLLVLHLS